MRRLRILTFACLLCSGALVACGTTDDSPQPGDTDPDVAAETGDSSPDVPEDAENDIEDVEPDPPTDTDVGPDGDDTTPDAGEDADGDSGEDATSDPDATDAAACPGPNPAGCRTTGCADGEVCWTDFWPGISCTPSECGCDEDAGSWICTDDCGGGECVPEPGDACEDDSDCTFGARWCESGVCEECNNDVVLCDIDCGDRGLLVRNGCHPCECNPEPQECGAEPTTGCYTNEGCDEGESCVPHDLTVCIPSECTCDPSTGTWGCTRDCAPGLCRETESACDTPNPAGCVSTGCDEGWECRTSDTPCIPSTCFCDEETGEWGCTEDCGGGICVPESTSSCATDADCAAGAQWCEDGACVDCDNSGFVCDLACGEGEELQVRNGCYPCACVPINECVDDDGCEPWQACEAGDECLSWCPEGEPSCCYGNRCYDLPD